jgi:hypothetical protein
VIHFTDDFSIWRLEWRDQINDLDGRYHQIPHIASISSIADWSLINHDDGSETISEPKHEYVIN